MPWHWIAVGGALGAVSRAALSGFINAKAPDSLAWGTLAANVLGCLLLGAVVQATADRADLATLRAGVGIGFLGAFTTFSTFGVETLRFVQDGHPDRALANVLANVVFGLGAAWLGMLAGRSWAAG